MRLLLTLAVPGLMLAAAAVPARAAVYTASFSGTVTSAVGVANAIGSTVTGSFVYNSDLSRFVSFTVAGNSATPGYNSIVSSTPGVNPFSALYETQISPVQQGGTLNQTLSLDLEALTSFSSSTALSILTSPTLSTQLDPTLSQFTYYTGNADGTNVRRLTAALNVTSVSAIASQVPEPASLALLAGPMIGLVLRRRR